MLSSVLAATQVHGVIFGDFRHHVPFGLEMTETNVAGFHYVLQGSCVVRAPRRAPIPMLQGDLLLVPSGCRHAIADSADSRVEPIEDFLARGVRPSRAPFAPRIVCGAYRHAQARAHPLMELLPPLLHLPSRLIAKHPPVSSTLRLLTTELDDRGVGSNALLDRLVDVLFVYVVRAWLEEQPAGAGGWLGALRDVPVGRALAAIHDRPDRRWTNESLAEHAGLSRAAFARRFATLVGLPPLAYVTRWRLELAARRLETTDETIARIAADVGYENEFAFSRAFKRELGVPPSRFRHERAPA